MGLENPDFLDDLENQGPWEDPKNQNLGEGLENHDFLDVPENQGPLGGQENQNQQYDVKSLDLPLNHEGENQAPSEDAQNRVHQSSRNLPDHLETLIELGNLDL